MSRAGEPLDRLRYSIHGVLYPSPEVLGADVLVHQLEVVEQLAFVLGEMVDHVAPLFVERAKRMSASG